MGVNLLHELQNFPQQFELGASILDALGCRNVSDNVGK
jgi:hypothetical protein